MAVPILFYLDQRRISSATVGAEEDPHGPQLADPKHLFDNLSKIAQFVGEAMFQLKNINIVPDLLTRSIYSTTCLNSFDLQRV